MPAKKTTEVPEKQFLLNTTARPISTRLWRSGQKKARRDGSHMERVVCFPGQPVETTEAIVKQLKDKKLFEKYFGNGGLVVIGESQAQAKIAEFQKEEKERRANQPENKIADRKRKREMMARQRKVEQQRVAAAADRDDAEAEL